MREKKKTLLQHKDEVIFSRPIATEEDDKQLWIFFLLLLFLGTYIYLSD